MSSVIIWAILLMFWIAISVYYVKRDKPTFWVCWTFFFLGWTAMGFFNDLGILLGLVS